MLEKEIKILDIDKLSVEKTLEDLGARKVFEGFIHDIYYDFPKGSMEDNDRIFRIRKKGETHLYTIKRKRKKGDELSEEGLKVADEGESHITDVESFQKVLQKYGMKQVREKKKHRTAYVLGEVCFDIDEYDGIPTLLEIEAAEKNIIYDFINRLGLQNHIQKSFGSRGLYAYYDLEYNYL